MKTFDQIPRGINFPDHPRPIQIQRRRVRTMHGMTRNLGNPAVSYHGATKKSMDEMDEKIAEDAKCVNTPGYRTTVT